MKRKVIKAAVVLSAVWIGAAGMTGCSGKKYEAVALEAEEEAGAPEQEENDEEADGEAGDLESSSLQAERTKAPAPVFAEVNDVVYVKGSQVRLRTVPSTESADTVAAVLENGTELTRTGDSDDWCRVSYNGQTLYVSRSLVTTEAPVIKAEETKPISEEAAGADNVPVSDGTQVSLNSEWKYAEYSAIHSGAAVMYRSTAAERKEITVCVNAGHGTSGGGSVKTLCHPDGTPKVTGGTTGAGATRAIAVSGGMTFSDGTPESKVTLAMAKALKEKLLAAGYDVLMIRESDDVQLDNIARTVIANQMADCHIALHWDSTTSNKGAFYMSVPDVASYRAMEPVASNWKKHHALGESLVSGLKGAGVKIFSGGSMAMDLTQTSYSTVPSVDIELGDKASDHSAGTLDVLAAGLTAGVNEFFGK